MDLYPYTQMFPSNRRFSAAASIFPSFEKLSKSQKNNLLRSTPVLTVSNYDEEQIQKDFNNSDRSYYDQKTSFTPAEIYANIDDDIEESEYDSLLTPKTTDRSQTSILPFPYYNWTVFIFLLLFAKHKYVYSLNEYFHTNSNTWKCQQKLYWSFIRHEEIIYNFSPMIIHN